MIHCPVCHERLPLGERLCRKCQNRRPAGPAPTQMEPAVAFENPFRSGAEFPQLFSPQPIAADSRWNHGAPASKSFNPPPFNGFSPPPTPIEETPSAEEPQPPPNDENIMLYRPLLRPPMATVYVLDDDGIPAFNRPLTGECFRLRGDHFLIGRVEGDAVINHDTSISGKHCEIVRTIVNRAFVWKLVDLGSTNGTFILVKEAELTMNREFIVGGRRFRFVPALHTANSPSRPPADNNHTMKSIAPRSEDLASATAKLVDISNGSEGQTYPLAERRILLGSDRSQCQVVIQGDPMLSSVHAEILLEGKSIAKIRDCNSCNGVWVRVDGSCTLDNDRMVHFQVGEQRLVFKVCQP